MKEKAPDTIMSGKKLSHFPAQKMSIRRKRSHKYMHFGAKT